LLSEPARWQPVKVPINIRHLATSPPQGPGQIPNDKVNNHIQASGACNSCSPVLLLLMLHGTVPLPPPQKLAVATSVGCASVTERLATEPDGV
jgi:hypothetical protein